ncbi:hypothetical protein SH449x_004188 [Pirellulaceae bacterium SH449]
MPIPSSDQTAKFPIKFYLVLAACTALQSLGCANTNGYNNQPCYPYNAYPYPPQGQVPGAFQPAGAPAVMPGPGYPTGMAPVQGYNVPPGFNGQPAGGPGTPFIGS